MSQLPQHRDASSDTIITASPAHPLYLAPPSPPPPTTRPSMLSYRTQGYQGYAVKYSPFFDSRLACAASANFGLVGNGRLYVLQLTPQGIVAEKWFPLPPSPSNSSD